MVLLVRQNSFKLEKYPNWNRIFWERLDFQPIVKPLGTFFDLLFIFIKTVSRFSSLNSFMMEAVI